VRGRLEGSPGLLTRGALALGLDVDAPARQAGGEACVLAFLADGEREFAVGDDDGGGLRVRVDGHTPDAGRLEGLRDDPSGFVRERDDVDLLAAQLVHDGTDARALRTHARADRVDVRVVGRDGEL